MSALQAFEERFQDYGSTSELEDGSLELQREAADDPLRRADDEQLVVHRLISRGIAEEIADREQHLPLRRTEVHERQRLAYLHVEPRIELRTIGGRRCDALRHQTSWMREAV